MSKLYRMAVLVGALAAVAVIAAQMVSAAPTPKSGSSYVTDGSAQLSGFGTVIADMTVAAARYHVTATVLVHDGGPVASPELSGGRITTIQCDLKSGSTVLTSARTSIDLGGYATVALDDVLDASAAGAPGVDISVSCSGSGPDSIGSATIVADSMVSIVILP